MTQEFLEEHRITTVVHGDDLSPEGAASIYASAVASGQYVAVPRTGTLSTTELIQRVLDAASSEP